MNFQLSNVLWSRQSTMNQTTQYILTFDCPQAAGLIALCSGLLSRFFAGFSLDRSATDATICKSRAFIVWVSATASSWRITYATIDRYCTSCREVRLRNLSNLRYTRRAMIITVVSALTVFAETFYCHVPNLRNAPLAGYAQNMVCRFYNETASALIYVFIPSTILFIFGYATILNVRKFTLFNCTGGAYKRSINDNEKDRSPIDSNVNCSSYPIDYIQHSFSCSMSLFNINIE
ncbi:unnamed protein product [Rotaria socialis]|uniref:G-protein coupled receptors family 1 profile domain-containing protein n=2 Tax=Rotaria socialis TaxID=392032 RepID=A0A818IZ99_9BILA|nr:unnamed protein product [Rotaria socialis]CAF4133126.1 unnamed protein product [Rotaria socialis]CAF4539886.1 unnamed protein product [Rotaria socialis]